MTYRDAFPVTFVTSRDFAKWDNCGILRLRPATEFGEKIYVAETPPALSISMFWLAQLTDRDHIIESIGIALCR